jgi:hypothetical protein
MKLSKATKVVIGFGTAITTLGPFLFPMIWLLAIGTIPFVDLDSSQALALPFFLFLIAFPIMIATSLVQIGLQVFYWSHIILNKAASDPSKILFGIGTFILPWLAMPFYFFIHVLPDSQEPNITPSPLAKRAA